MAIRPVILAPSWPACTVWPWACCAGGQACWVWLWLVTYARMPRCLVWWLPPGHLAEQGSEGDGAGRALKPRVAVDYESLDGALWSGHANSVATLVADSGDVNA